MHRAPLWAAVVLNLILLYLVLGEDPQGYSLNKEYMWYTILLNTIFIVITLIRANINAKEQQEIRNCIEKAKMDEDILRARTETKFINSKLIIENYGMFSEVEVDNAVNTLKKLVEDGYVPAIIFVAELMPK